MRIIILTGYLLLAGLWSLPAAADKLVLAEGAPAIYLVVEGDTLWGISSMYLRDPWLWPEIWEINQQLENPHLIFPGDEIYLVFVDGKPRLRVKRGKQARTVKMTPTVRIEPLDSAIPLISLEVIGAWLTQHRIVDIDVLEGAPYIIAGDNRHLLSSAGDRVYARGRLPEDETGFGLYRSGQIFKDPKTKEILGHEAKDIGSARLIDRHEEEIVQLEVTRMTEEVRIGDRLLPSESRRIASSFQPHASNREINGLMIAVDSGVSQIGTLDIVAINLGRREGVNGGMVMAIFQTGEVIRDEIMRENVRIPDARAGLLMVFRSFEKMSYGIVLKSNRPLAIMDRVSNP
jgi:hypothetical protein